MSSSGYSDDDIRILRETIEYAKKGSLQHFRSMVSCVKLPPIVARDTLSMCLYHISNDPFFIAIMPEADRDYCMTYGLGSLTIIRNLLPHLNENPSLRKTLVNAWDDISKWLRYIKVNRNKPRESSRLNIGPLHRAIAMIYAVALNADFTGSKPSLQGEIEEQAREDLPELFMMEDVSSGCGPFITAKVATCLMLVNDQKQFTETLVAKTFGTQEAFVEEVLKRGKTLLKSSPVDYDDIANIVFFFLSLSQIKWSSTSHSESLQLWDVGLKNGSVPFVLKVFDKLSRWEVLRLSPPPANAILKIVQCLKFFDESLMQYGRNGAAILIQLLRGRFLDSFVRCSPIFGFCEGLGFGADHDFFKYFLFTHLASTLVYPLVIKHFASALELLDVEEKRRSIFRSSIKDEWESLEALVLERFIYKRLLEMTEETGKTTGREIPHKRRCTSCLGGENAVKFQTCSKCRIPSYCSKACQIKHWKEGNHRQNCGVTSDSVIGSSQYKAYAAILANFEVCRYKPGLHKLIASKYSSVPSWKVAYSLNFNQHPPQYGAFSLDDVTKGSMGSRPFLPQSGGPQSILNTDQYKSMMSEHFRQVEAFHPSEPVLAEVNFVQGYLLSSLYSPGPGGVQYDHINEESSPASVKRIRAEDTNGKEMAMKPGLVDKVIDLLNFGRTDDWYAGGKGTVERLNLRIETLLKERLHFNRLLPLITAPIKEA